MMKTSGAMFKKICKEIEIEIIGAKFDFEEKIIVAER